MQMHGITWAFIFTVSPESLDTSGFMENYRIIKQIEYLTMPNFIAFLPPDFQGFHHIHLCRFVMELWRNQAQLLNSLHQQGIPHINIAIHSTVQGPVFQSNTYESSPYTFFAASKNLSCSATVKNVMSSTAQTGFVYLAPSIECQWFIQNLNCSLTAAFSAP